MTASLPQVLVATLCPEGLMSHELTHALLKLMGSSGQPRASFGLLTSAPGTHAPGARDALLTRVLDAQAATHVLFIDSDIVFEPAAVHRLLAFDEDVVAADCGDLEQPASARSPREARGDFITATYADASFMMIKRSALERAARSLPVERLFHWMVEPTTGDYLKEDFAFCHRFCGIGGKVWIDTRSPVRRVVGPGRHARGLTVPARKTVRSQGLHSLRLRLSPVEPADAMELWAAIDESRSELEAWIPSARFNTDADATHRYALSSADDWDCGRACRVAIRDADTGAVLGVVGLEAFDRERRSVELGYWLRSSATGRGFATEACRTLISWAFSSLSVQRVRASVATENRASLAVVGRLGFRSEGTARCVELCQGRWLDHEIFALVGPDLPGVGVHFAPESP